MRNIFLLMLFLSIGCLAQTKVVTGAEQIELIISKIKSGRIGLLVNHTAVVGKTHLVDTLRSSGINVVKIFSPEHGFRGTADAGEEIKDGVDVRTNIPIISLYGANKKPSAVQLEGLDFVIFDIQDVGVRFFTFISSLHYMMEACAENNVKLIILDRPNPNGGYVDGPVLKKEFKSFVGMHPIPIVHGLTVGELAQMINEEGWLEGKLKCNLEVIPVKHWKHSDNYSIKIKPSPNLTTDQAIALYPSTCLFEGTVLSVGRGTLNPFELVGHPDLKSYTFNFTPICIEGMAKNPVLENKVCFGLDLRKVKLKPELNLKYLIELYKAFPYKENFFNAYFEKLAGTEELRKQIKSGMSEKQIKATWEGGLKNYKELRQKYLLYP